MSEEGGGIFPYPIIYSNKRPSSGGQETKAFLLHDTVQSDVFFV